MPSEKSEGTFPVGKKGSRPPVGVGFVVEGEMSKMKKEHLAYMKKQGIGGATADVSRTPIQFLDVARFDPILFFIQHRDRKELNFRLRYYYEFQPLVNNAINLHSSFPVSDFVLVCGDSKIQQYYNDFKDDIALIQLLIDILKDYWLLGESFTHGRWDDIAKTWTNFIMFPPENIVVKGVHVIDNPILYLEVNEGLRKLVTSQDAIDKALVKLIDPSIVGKIETGANIPLERWCTTHMARKTSRYDLRGTSIVKSILKDLMYEDKLRLLQFTFADRHMFPLKIFKLGNPQTGWVPSRKHFDALRDLLISAQNDPDFNIIFHHGLQVDYIGTKDKIANLVPEFEFVENRILTGLFTNKAITHGEGPTYANASVAMRVLMNRYLVIRNLLEQFMKVKVFKKIAEARAYYKSDTTNSSGQKQERVQGKYKVLDLPRIKWRKLNLLDNTQQQQMMMNLRKDKQLDHASLMEMFDHDPETIVEALKKEESTIVDAAYIKAREAFVKDPAVAEQILRGEKGPKLELESEEDEGKKKPKGEVTPSSSGGAGGAGGGGGVTPPALDDTEGIKDEKVPEEEAIPEVKE